MAAGAGQVGGLESGRESVVVAEVDGMEGGVGESGGGLCALGAFDVDEVDVPVALGGEGLGYSEADAASWIEGAGGGQL